MTTKDKLYNIFYCTVGSCRVVTETGRVLSFVSNNEGKFQFITANEEDIAYLQREIKAGHPHLYVAPGEEQKTAEELDPEAMLKKKYFAMFEAEKLEKSEQQQKPEVKTALNPSSTAQLTNTLATKSAGNGSKKTK